MRPPSPSIPEREFLLSALRESLRLDGRQLLEQRTPTLTFGAELGWVECALGKTRVIANVDAKMVKPTPERPFEGILSIHAEISPMASTEYEPGRPSEEEVAMNRMLDKVLRRSDVLDKESLCILAGQRVWHLRLTIHCLADSGNLLDCACLAGAVALRHYRRPDVEVIGDEVIVHDPLERAPVPLALHHTPYCLTFSFFPLPPAAAPTSPSPKPDKTAITLLDASALEARLAAGTLSVAITAAREVCVLHTNGGAAVLPDEVLFVVDVAARRAVELDVVVERRLKEDWTGRKARVELL